MALLLYRAGLRVLECARLRVKDIDFESNQIVVRAGKGDRDRVTMLPVAVKVGLARHLEFVKGQHVQDLRRGAGWVELPGALMQKYPTAGQEWGWQWVFPATRVYVDRVSGQRRRHHLHETRASARRQRRDAPSRPRQACDVPHFPPLVCHPSARGWARHPHGPGVTRTPGREHDHDLHPRPEPWSGGGAEPGRSVVRTIAELGKPLWVTSRRRSSQDC